MRSVFQTMPRSVMLWVEEGIDVFQIRRLLEGRMARAFDRKTLFLLPGFWRNIFEDVETLPKRPSGAVPWGRKGRW